ncbi:MAG: PilZ domain-containing protein [Nitrospirota bacterium]
MDGSSKEERNAERIPASIAVRFTYNRVSNSLYYGTVLDISKSGMLVRTGNCFPSYTNIVLFIYKEKILMVNAKVRRLIKNDGFCMAMGIEVVAPNEEYLDFVDRLMTVENNP